VKGHGTPLREIEGTLRAKEAMEGHGTPLRTMKHHGGPWNTIESY
jgi:hypothetical protein